MRDLYFLKLPCFTCCFLTDIIGQFFLAKTDVLKRIGGWDDSKMVIDHDDFFFRVRRYVILSLPLTPSAHSKQDHALKMLWNREFWLQSNKIWFLQEIRTQNLTSWSYFDLHTRRVQRKVLKAVQTSSKQNAEAVSVILNMVKQKEVHHAATLFICDFKRAIVKRLIKWRDCLSLKNCLWTNIHQKVTVVGSGWKLYIVEKRYLLVVMTHWNVLSLILCLNNLHFHKKQSSDKQHSPKHFEFWMIAKISLVTQ